MPSLLVEIVRYTEECFPGWAECRLIDAGGRDWRFLKPRARLHTGSSDDRLPAVGRIDCEVLERLDGSVLVSTASPRGIKSLEGENRFRIPLSALIED
ncbi:MULTISPECIES: hypothetical protein [Pseudomonas]|uniref:Uncharacterized protein n=1 Tax=Pseudomonas nitroreducens TaxID=46680 RepID=A0ABS0KTU9_PSENT|nr:MULTISPECIES: hypothetical protein [Pseudomonas]MBG6291525.1 hypothetical protein [Pseudomonas nitroreducens]MCJ1877900.1 hypothetical protein [Pseudomonas nitroreducens]MCJ1894297.1 hypothetical protein [Pseudomonas nitroreducens]MDG9855056.1 hypothetical protein [Pseudomonas nitroreducens]MDH1074103.1 hypothetical protein [Pseudomonas nitroreducens]